jgi:hypothetical protein
LINGFWLPLRCLQTFLTTQLLESGLQLQYKCLVKSICHVIVGLWHGNKATMKENLRKYQYKTMHMRLFYFINRNLIVSVKPLYTASLEIDGDTL